MPETDDLATLNSLDDAAVASILEDRYSRRRIYTRVNSMLISINPYEELGLYSTAVLDEYCRVGNGGPPPPPHAFAVAAEAFSGLLSSQSQSVLVTGESGAGKTETCRRLLQYLAHAANRGGAADTRALHEALSQTSCVLEAFGNARTVMNDNSSRYGKFLTLRYDKTARLQGASFSTFLLEQTRVVRVAPAERSFHVFYALLAGLSSTEAAELQLDCLAPNGYTYIATSDAVGGPAAADEAARDASALSEIGAALELLGTPRATQWQAWRVLAAVLRLGNVVVSAAADGGTEVARVDEGESAASLEAAAQLLGVSHTALSSAVTTRCLKAGGEFIQTPQTCAAAAEVRDGLAKALYSRLFDRLVAAINDSPQVAGSDGGGEGGGGSGAGPFVGLLDIFGFEDFESNSLEQLLINFSNEHLQAIFNSIIFSAAQAEAEAEGVPPPQFDAEAVSNVSTIALFSAPHSGLFALLNEECVFPKGTDESFVAKLHAANKEHSRLSVLQPEGSAFRVAHYAGSVKYQASGFLNKNKAPFSEDLLVLLRTSSEPFVATLFAQEAAAPQAGKRGGRGFRGVVGGYAAELDELLRVIRSSTAHFVRCIKPNVRKAARCFEEPVVMRQLRCGGVLEAVRVFASGFPDRMPIRDFVGTYCSVVAPSKLPPHPPGGPPSQGDAPTAWERGACAAILRAFDVADEATALGHTKVFLGAGVAAHCKAKREARLAGLIAVVQAAARGLLARRSLRRRAALREKEEERERQIAALQAQQEAERAATRGAVGLRRKASFEREASVKRRQQQERAAAAKRTEEATASWAAREAELTKLHTELTRQAGRKQAALAAELAQLTAALRKAEERNAALERAQAEERAAAAAREVELQTAVSHWRDEAALAAQREQQASEMGEARLAQAVEREGEARDEASFFRARFQELALSFARAQDPAPPRSRPPNADGGGFFGAVASLIGGGAKPRPSRGRGRTSLSASRPAGDAPSSPAEKARAPPQAPLFSPRTMSIAEEPYSPPQPPAPRDAPTPADATALASYLGLHPVRDAKLMWIAEAAAAEPLPEGWSEVVDPGGRLYYSNGVTGESSRVHPRDEEFRLLVMRSKLEQMHSAPAAQPSAGDWSTIRMKSLEQSLSSAASAPVRALVQRSGDRRGGAPRLTFEMLLDEDTRLPWMEAVLREGPRGAAFELLLEGGAAEKSEHLVRLSGPSSSVLVRRERRDAPLPEDGPVGEEEELAAVIFVEVLGEADESGARGGEEAPYSMELVVPAAKRGGATQAHKPRGPSDTLLQRYGRGETEGLLVFVGQVARSAAAEAPSAAVRLSLPKTDSGNLLLQTSGRRGANRATLEYRDPLSPLAAFSAALALVHWSERAQSALARAAIGKGRLSVG